MMCLFGDLHVGAQFLFQGNLYIKVTWREACMIIGTNTGLEIRFSKKELVERVV